MLALALALDIGADLGTDVGTAWTWVDPAQALAATGGLLLPGTAAWADAVQTIAGTGTILAPVAWWQSDLGVTQSGGTVSAWADQSTSGNNLAASGATKPAYTATDTDYNGLPSLSFTAASNTVITKASFVNAPSQPYSMIVVAKNVVGGTLIQSGSIACGLDASGGGGTFGYYAGTNVNTSHSGANSPFVFCVVFNGASSKAYLNSSASTIATGNPNTNACSGLIQLGAGGLDGSMTGTIAAAGVYSSALTQDQVAALFRGLGNKYNHAWS